MIDDMQDGSRVRYGHYSLLATIEASWGLAPLTANDDAATPMSDFFPVRLPYAVP